ncbi:MAG: hypothetical protein KBH45_06365 [Verrucomicrobia bacterium]|nr:hypothetical protein [Verrucomicrobiota bacterium]
MIKRFNSLLAFIVIPVLTYAVLSTAADEIASKEVARTERNAPILRLIESPSPNHFGFDQHGDLIRIALPQKLNIDSNLALIATCPTVTDVTVWFTKRGNPFLSKSGFDCLRKLPRLEKLEIGCCELIPGEMFASMCELTNLKVLSLNRAEPSDEDYVALTNLVRLEELSIAGAAHFGDPEFKRLNVLRHLRKITLYSPSVSYRCLDAVSGFPSLTNFVATRRRLEMGDKMEKIEWSKLDR